MRDDERYHERLHFMAAFWAVFIVGVPAISAHGSLDLKQ
jgi:hypothetical protein